VSLIKTFPMTHFVFCGPWQVSKACWMHSNIQGTTFLFSCSTMITFVVFIHKATSFTFWIAQHFYCPTFCDVLLITLTYKDIFLLSLLDFSFSLTM
jgi:hypothetical protein